MNTNIIDILINELRRALSRTNDIADIFIISLIISGLTYGLNSKSSTNTNTKEVVKDEVEWLLEESNRCDNEECIERVVKEVVKKIKTNKRMVNHQ